VIPDIILIVLGLSLCPAFVRPSAALLQSPGFPVGKLAIQSIPTGANIAINGRAQTQQTNTTYVVSPANYAVTVTGGPGNLNCSGSYAVAKGSTVTLICDASGKFRQQ
jgi:PEGA domain-containing protein